MAQIRRQIVKALVDAGAPVHSVDLNTIDPDIVPLIVQSKKFYILPEHATAHVIKALAGAQVPPAILKKFAPYLYKERLIHMLSEYEHKQDVLAYAKNATI
jgi:hypothetical protein